MRRTIPTLFYYYLLLSITLVSSFAHYSFDPKCLIHIRSQLIDLLKHQFMAHLQQHVETRPCLILRMETASTRLSG